MKRTIVFSLLILLLIKIEVFTVGCANMIPPTGGPRDSLPPRLVSARPGDSTRNFSGKRITFEFNEYVQVENYQQNLLVSPTTKLIPQVDPKLKTVTVTFSKEDTLDPNTTYSLNFGNAIKDVNEGNVMRDFTYIFSTGPVIDSLSVTGKVIMAETGKTDSTLIAALYTNLDDSAVYKEIPRYITRISRDGSFTFHNLPSGIFALYAFKDESGQKKYLDSTQEFAFADSTVSSSTNPQPIVLYAYNEEEKKPASSSGVPSVRATNVRGTATAEKRLRLETNLSAGELDLLEQLEFYFRQAPLKTFDSTKVRFTTETFEAINDYQIIRDTSNTKVTLQYNWRENTTYNIIVDKDFAEDTAGRKILRNDTLSFKTKKTSEYGAIRLRLLNLDLSKNPVLLFVQNEQIKTSHPLTSRQLNIPLYVPGEYELRILYDDNKNGKWDPGSFFETKRQPEKVEIIPRKLTVKANWDNEVDISL